MQNATDKQKARNLSEIAFLKNCKHPNIVEYFSALKIKNEIWVCAKLYPTCIHAIQVVMEFMEGGTLSEACKGYDFQDPHVAYVAQEVS